MLVFIKHIEIKHRLRDSEGNTIQASVMLRLSEYPGQDYSRTTRTEKLQQQVRISGIMTWRRVAYDYLGDASLWTALMDNNPSAMLETDGVTIPEGTLVTIPKWDDIAEYLPQDDGLVEFNVA